MASYLLLRNNKESGPFNLDDLVKFGLKPYDLVWIQGKSAAWRYPSEIVELKAFAPVVEEQPFDRFFKKPSPIKEEKAIVTPVTAEVKEMPIVEKMVAEEVMTEEKYEKYIPKKSVFVTLPGQASQTSQNGKANQNGQSSQNSLNSQYAQKAVTAQKTEPVPQPQPVPEPAPIITVTENPEAAKIKFSQPLDEIKEMYVKTLQERKNKKANKSFLMGNLKKAAVVIGLVTLGILAGFAIKSESENDTLGLQSINNTAPTTIAASNPANIDQQANVTQAHENITPVSDHSTVQTPEDNPQPLPNHIKQEITLRAKKDLIIPAETKKEPVITPIINRPVRYEEPQPVERNPVTGERSKKVRSENDIVEDRPMPKAVMSTRKSGLESLVSISSNDYKRVAFGGIRNLELTITNDSRFVLDKVTVQLEYLKPSEEPLKTELIKFHSVSPNGSMTMRIKDTNRGIKVSYRIIDIQAQQTETALRE